MVTTIICYAAIAVSLSGFAYGVFGLLVTAVKATKENIKESAAE